MIELTDPKIQKYLTPYRYEKPVLHGSGMLGAFDEKAVDIPFVFVVIFHIWFATSSSVAHLNGTLSSSAILNAANRL